MAITMQEQQRWSSISTLVWHCLGLYIFNGSIAGARNRGAEYIGVLTRGEDVAQLPHQAVSLVWMEDVPYLFPGSLTAASERGKGYKRGKAQVLRERREAEERALVKFVKQYGQGIGEA